MITDKSITAHRYCNLHDFWILKAQNQLKYEDELRLCAELRNDLSEKECVTVKIPKDFGAMISVIFCPGFDKVKNKEFLVELKLQAIHCSDSVYDPIYSNLLSRREAPNNDIEGKTLHLGVQ